MAALFGVHHAFFEIEQLWRRDLDALDTRRGDVSVGPQVAGKNVAQKIALHDLMVLDARGKAVLALKLGVGFGVITAWVDGVGLADITPAVTGLGAGMLGEKITPFAIHFEVRHGVTRRADRDFELVATAVCQPARQTLALLVVFGRPLDIVAAFAQCLDLRADRIVLAVGDLFSNSSDICHGNLLKISYFAE